MNTENKKEWIKPDLIIICESEINENLLGSTDTDNNNNGIPDHLE